MQTNTKVNSRLTLKTWLFINKFNGFVQIYLKLFLYDTKLFTIFKSIVKLLMIESISITGTTSVNNLLDDF